MSNGFHLGPVTVHSWRTLYRRSRFYFALTPYGLLRLPDVVIIFLFTALFRYRLNSIGVAKKDDFEFLHLQVVRHLPGSHLLVIFHYIGHLFFVQAFHCYHHHSF